MSEQTTGSQFVAPQEMVVSEAGQTAQITGVRNESELMLPLVAAEQDTSIIPRVSEMDTDEQPAEASWMSGRAKRIAAALTLMSVVGAGAVACGEEPPRPAITHAGTSTSAQPTTTAPARTTTRPTVESIDPSAIQARVGVAECRFTDGTPPPDSNDGNVVSLSQSILRQDVAGLLQSTVPDIHPCDSPLIMTAINDGKIITSAEFEQQSTGILVETWVSLDTQDADGYSAEATALVGDILANKASGMRLSANEPGQSNVIFKGAVAAYADPDNPERIKHEEGVISYKDNNGPGVTYDLRIAIDNGQRATANVADQVSLPALNQKLIAWLSKAFVDLKYN